MTIAASTADGPDADRAVRVAAPPLPPARRPAVFATILAASVGAHAVIMFLLLAADRLDGPATTTTEEIPVEIVTEAPGRAGPASRAAVSDKAPESASNAGGGAEKPTARGGPAPAASPREPRGAAEPPSRGAAAAPAANPAAAKPQAQGEAPAQPQPRPPGQRASPAPSNPPPKPPATKGTAAAATPATSFGPLPGSFNAVVLPGTTIGGQEAVSYRALVFSQIAKAKHFPEAARARGASGVAVVSFTVDDAGTPLGVALTHSSGDPDIDAEIVAMIGRAAPFPPPPQGAQRSFSAAIEFGRDE